MHKYWQSGYIKARQQAAFDMPVGDAFSGPAYGHQHDVGSILGGGLGFIGDIFGASQAEDAEDKQYAANQEASQFQRETRDLIRADNAPFLKTGYQANDLIAALLGSGAVTKDPSFADYKQDPSYGFQQSEAAKAIQGSAAARGGLYSGRTLQALGDRSQNIANADFGQWWNRQQQGTSNKVNMLNAIRSGGQASAGVMGSASQNAANQIGSNLLARGDNAADSLIAQGAIGRGALNRMSSYGGGGSGGGMSSIFNMFGMG